MLTRAQGTRFDDQRGLNVNVTELPEFLRSGHQHRPLETGDEVQIHRSLKSEIPLTSAYAANSKV